VYCLKFILVNDQLELSDKLILETLKTQTRQHDLPYRLRYTRMLENRTQTIFLKILESEHNQNIMMAQDSIYKLSCQLNYVGLGIR